MSMNLSTLETLRETISGDVLFPGDDGFPQSHFAWNLTIQHQPAIVVMAENPADVQAAVRYAAASGLRIAVQATGHGQPRCCDGGLLVNMSRMKEVVIEPIERRAKVQGGCRWLDVLPKAQEHGLAALSGSAPHVGIVGYTLGGGFGLMIRKHGLMVDSVRSLEVVTADGEILTASHLENPDLFWALLGGGGAYGVVTAIEFDLCPNGTVFGGSVMYPAERREEIFGAYAGWTKDLSEDVTSSIALMTFPPVPFVPEFLHGKSVVIVTGCVTSEASMAEELLKPMRELGDPIVDTFGEIDYANSGIVFQDPVDPLPAGGRGVLLKDLTPDIAVQILEAIGEPALSPNLQIQIRHLEGAMGRIPHDATAVGNRREAKYLMYFLGVPMGPVTLEAMAEHAEGVIEKIAPHILCRGPLNWLGEGSVRADHIREVFDPSDYERLKSVKSKFDPDNRFGFAGVGI